MLNRVSLIGRIGKDPEVRSTQSGSEIASFSVATSESWKDRASGERKERTHWHNVVVFSEGLVRVVKQYAQMGQLVLVEGQLQTRKWQDRDGNDRYSTEVVLQGFDARFQMLERRDGDGQPRAEGARPAALLDNDSDAIPF